MSRNELRFENLSFRDNVVTNEPNASFDTHSTIGTRETQN